jgi:hypothetical protein
MLGRCPFAHGVHRAGHVRSEPQNGLITMKFNAVSGPSVASRSFFCRGLRWPSTSRLHPFLRLT